MAIKTGEKVEFVGAVLAEREENYYDDSDFYALVWDEALQEVRKVYYASTRYWSYDCHAVVDATDEVLAKVEAWASRELFKALKAEDEQASVKVALHKLVRSVSKRSKKFQFDTLAWASSPYVNGYGDTVVDLDPADGGARVYGVGITQVEVVAPEQYLKSDEQLMAQTLTYLDRVGAVGVALRLHSKRGLTFIP